jgi:hypothetical protein
MKYLIYVINFKVTMMITEVNDVTEKLHMSLF